MGNKLKVKILLNKIINKNDEIYSLLKNGYEEAKLELLETEIELAKMKILELVED